eukprot:TRINITY_DN33229_c0_g1_i1.p1 TRINITY_DN33229_c0_g1~~TRINITY_DN33229_c0_g1_i1.p1  ORF type:complete len:398 (+),score=55.75 TRINITY_DN33229_c0_g1_i1:51-1244(+)
MLRRASQCLLSSQKFKLVECPRDAIQALKDFIPTSHKIKYLNALLRCGFDTVDFGSFVSAPMVPQMRDTGAVVKGLDLANTSSKLLAIVCNTKGASDAAEYPEISAVGFPLSVSETFQQKNTGKSIQKAFEQLKRIQDIAVKGNQELVTYISMGFGNPYGEAYSADIVEQFVDRLDKELAVKVISLADTVGCSNPEIITDVFSRVIPKYPHIEFGAHFHSDTHNAMEKIKAAYSVGVRRLDGALGGMGGCPFAKSTLTGNIPTEAIKSFLESEGVATGLDEDAFATAVGVRELMFGVSVKELLLGTLLGDPQYFSTVVRTHFDQADTKQTGFVDNEEFEAILNSTLVELGETPVSSAKATEVFNRYDKNEDNMLSFDEYQELVRFNLMKRLEIAKSQ